MKHGKCIKCKYGRGCPKLYDLLIPLSSGGFVIFQSLMITNLTERRLRWLDYLPVSLVVVISPINI